MRAPAYQPGGVPHGSRRGASKAQEARRKHEIRSDIACGSSPGDADAGVLGRRASPRSPRPQHRAGARQDGDRRLQLDAGHGAPAELPGVRRSRRPHRGRPCRAWHREGRRGVLPIAELVAVRRAGVRLLEDRRGHQPDDADLPRTRGQVHARLRRKQGVRRAAGISRLRSPRHGARHAPGAAASPALAGRRRERRGELRARAGRHAVGDEARRQASVRGAAPERR